jgi:nucleoside-diphosphate-sugar epimerase
MKRVLVTGGSGFIGRHTLAPLMARGYDVHVADVRRPETTVPITFHGCDLLAPGESERLLEAVKPTHLLHLAWYATPGLYWNAPENLAFLAASTELLHVFRRKHGTRVVMTGTCAEYDWDSGYCTEGVTPLAPNTIYGVCKDALRRVSEIYTQGTGVSWAWARPFFFYGPHENPKRLVASVITALLAGQPALMTHGRQIRDLMHVEDVAGGIVALLDSPVTGAVNISSGVPTTLAAVAQQIGSLLNGVDLLRLGAVAAAPREPPMVVGNARRLHEEVGFTPRYDLASGLQATVAWWRATTPNLSGR